jgi:hypothetical protein
MVGMGQRGQGSGAEVERTPLRFGSIELSENGISELTREGHRTVFVPRPSVQRVTAARGFTSERPIAALLGAVVCFGGTGCISWAVLSHARDGVLHFSVRVVMAAVFLAAVGTSFLVTLVRRGRYLRVDTARESRKLIVDRAVDVRMLREALHVGRSRFGYNVDTTSLEEGESESGATPRPLPVASVVARTPHDQRRD